MRFAFLYDQLPVTYTHSHLVCFMEFPIQIIMFLLHFIISHQGRSKRDTIEAVTVKLLVQILFGEFLIANQFTESRHNIIESQLMVINCSGFYFTRPTYYERNPDSTFIALAFQTAQLSATTEKLGVCSTLFMRTVITAENHYCIFIQAFLFKLSQYFTYICVQTRCHSGKLGMSMYCRIVSAAF